MPTTRHDVPTCGHQWIIAWGNPYTDPPGGMDRVQASAFARSAYPTDQPAELQAIYEQLGGPGSGWSWYYRHLTPAPKRHSPEQRGAARVRALTRRVTSGRRAVGPMFAEDIIQETISANPDYYAGAEVDAERAQYVANFDATTDQLWQDYLTWYHA